MTEKEKAEELVRSFMMMKPTKLSDYSKIYLPTAKECALRVVNEIYYALYNYLRDTDELQNSDREWAYWEAVKKEIEKL